MKRELLCIFASVLLVSCSSQRIAEDQIFDFKDCEGNPLPSALNREYELCIAKAPLYPTEALEKEIEGACITTFDINVSGRIKNAVTECTPSGFFEKATLEAKKHFVYLPRIENGQPVVTRAVVRGDNFEFGGTIEAQ